MTKEVSKYRIKWGGKSRSKVQFRAKQFFKKYWSTHIVYEEFPVFGSLMKVDIVNATKKIAVEINGDQHGEFNEFFHRGSREIFRQSMNRDDAKLKWLERNGFKVIEVNEDEVDKLSPALIKEMFGIDIY
jgi:hypothetical protein